MNTFTHQKNINILSDENPIIVSHKLSFSTSLDFAMHIHPHYEIYICISGDAQYIVKNHFYHLQRGDIIVIPPHDLHSVRLNSSCKYERFYCQIPTDAFHSMHVDPLHEFEHNFSSGHNLLRPSPQKKERILSQLFQLSELSKIETSAAKLTTFGIFLEFLSAIIVEKGRESDYAENIPHSNMSPLVANALNYMEKNYRTIESVSEISATLGVTHPHLSSTFKQNLGISMKKYLQHLRIACAKQLLTENHSVSDVCFESGFNDYSYFIKIFRQRVGITPYQYKKTCERNSSND